MTKQDHEIVTFALRDVEGNPSGQRRFAVRLEDDPGPVVMADWSDNPQIASQADQAWDLAVWQRIEGRGYVARLQGSGQWANRGDHGVYVGTGVSAEHALRDAMGRGGYDDDEYIPQLLVSACRDYDQSVTAPEVE